MLAPPLKLLGGWGGGGGGGWLPLVPPLPMPMIWKRDYKVEYTMRQCGKATIIVGSKLL